MLQYTGWQKKRASEILGINASTLYRKLQTYKAQGLLGTTDEEEIQTEEPEALDEAA